MGQNWMEKIRAMTPRDWVLYEVDTQRSRQAAERMNNKLERLAVEGFSRIAKGVSREEVALSVRSQFSNYRDHNILGVGASDTEPDWVAADLIDEIFGTDNGRF